MRWTCRCWLEVLISKCKPSRNLLQTVYKEFPAIASGEKSIRAIIQGPIYSAESFPWILTFIHFSIHLRFLIT